MRVISDEWTLTVEFDLALDFSRGVDGGGKERKEGQLLRDRTSERNADAEGVLKNQKCRIEDALATDVRRPRY